jgi:F-type H+-transporting ATPase subunit b
MLALLLQPPEGGSQVEQIARTFGVDWPHLTAQILSFPIVCAQLYWLAYRPILHMLERRRQQIADGLANAEQIRAELAKTEAMRQDVLAHAHTEAKSIVREARAAASRIEAQSAQQANATAKDILAKAHQATEREHVLMLSDLKREVGRLVLRTTAAVTGKVLTDDDQRRLAEESARQLTGVGRDALGA